MAYIGLDATQHERTIGTVDNQPLPHGFYHGIVTRAEIKDVKDKPEHKYLEVEFDITHPSEFNRRKIWEKFNLINSNAITVKIAEEQLSDLSISMSLGTLNDSEELLGKEVAMMIDVTPPKGNFAAGNKVLKYLPIGSTESDYNSWLASKKGSKSNPPKRDGWGAQPAQPVTAIAETAGKKQSPWSAKK